MLNRQKVSYCRGGIIVCDHHIVIGLQRWSPPEPKQTATAVFEFSARKRCGRSGAWLRGVSFLLDETVFFLFLVDPQSRGQDSFERRKISLSGFANDKRAPGPFRASATLSRARSTSA